MTFKHRDLSFQVCAECGCVDGVIEIIHTFLDYCNLGENMMGEFVAKFVESCHRVEI